MKVLNRIIDIHLAGSLGLVEELKTINIKASWVPLIPGDFKTQIYSLPASPAVVAFIPEERPDFYKLSVLYELAASFQNVRFMIVGSKEGEPNCPGNISFLGFQKNMDEIYMQSNALIRIVEHDGLSLMVLEALSRGRQVIWSEQFPHCYYARDTASAKAALLKIINNPEINHNGASYVQETFNKNKIIGGLVEIYKGLIGR
jgi:glycosyltransferase involved in cell wall biosynthesis